MMNPRTVQPDDPQHLKEMFKLLGLSEIPGPKAEPKILALFKDAGHPEINDDETAWCAATVGACLKRAGFPNSGSLMARSYEHYGKACDASKKLPRGAIIVWPYGKPPHGHVNLVLDDDGKYLTCIGGNQSNGRGGGVTISRDLKSKIVSARVPTGVKIAKPATSESLPMSTSKIGNTQIVAGTTATVTAGATIADAVQKTSDVAQQTTTITDAAKSVAEAAPEGFWHSVLHVMTSPVFVGCACLVIVACAGMSWYWRRQHRLEGV